MGYRLLEIQPMNWGEYVFVDAGYGGLIIGKEYLEPCIIDLISTSNFKYKWLIFDNSVHK